VRALATDFGFHGVPRSRSATVPLSGGDASARFAARRRTSELSSVDPAIRQRWLDTYGGNAPALVDRVLTDPEAGRDLGAQHLSLAEVRYAVEVEMARTVADFFARRASIFFWTEDGGLSVADAVASEMAALLDWPAEERATQIAVYRDLVTANRFARQPA
jgi:glycerol-3-phosphate dehydrogenase